MEKATFRLHFGRQDHVIGMFERQVGGRCEIGGKYDTDGHIS
jgi:hypothetical protein